VAGATLLIIITSLLPWFRTRFAVDDSWASNTATAWQASSWWSVAEILCLLAGTLGLAGAARRRWALHPVTQWAAVALSGAAAILMVVIWRAIPGLNKGHDSFGWVATSATSHPVGDIVRDHLVLVQHNGLTQQSAWGLYAGLAAMILLTAVLTLRTIRP
jgi:hypothetical protein